MLKVGDYVICIDKERETGIPYESVLIIREINYYNNKSTNLRFEGLVFSYSEHLFISLKEYRKLKINKINKKKN